MGTAAVILIAGIILLVVSADRFVAGAAALATAFRMSPLLIGILIVGFGTSSPELVVSAMAACQGNPGIALGNAIGSNISNIALILGITALIRPLNVTSAVLKTELPLLSLATVVLAVQLMNLSITRLDALVLMILFSALMGWSCYIGRRRPADTLAVQMEEKSGSMKLSLTKAWFWTLGGLVFLVLSSRMVVSGAVTIARQLGVADMIIGLTVVAVGTSLPELASTIAAVRKGEHEIALGNILGSNLFNTLAVVGLAGLIRPMQVERGVLVRDLPVMLVLTLSLFALGYGFRGKPGRINRWEGGGLLAVYAAYIAWMVLQVV